MTDDLSALLASYDTPSAVRAVRWVRGSARELAVRLDGDERCRALRWLDGSDISKALDDLVSGELFEFSIACGRTQVLWTVRPVRFLPLAHRVARELPKCVGRFTCPTLTQEHCCGGGSC
jgi:hypothetical protein